MWASGDPAWIPDVTRDPNFPRADVAIQEGLHGAFGFPIRSGSELLGVIEFFSPRIEQPDDDLLQLFAAVGSEGSVYLTVGKDGGRVQINFANRLREFEAVSADGSTLPTGTPIRVQSVTANTLVVAPTDR